MWVYHMQALVLDALGCSVNLLFAKDSCVLFPLGTNALIPWVKVPYIFPAISSKLYLLRDSSATDTPALRFACMDCELPTFLIQLTVSVPLSPDQTVPSSNR